MLYADAHAKGKAKGAVEGVEPPPVVAKGRAGGALEDLEGASPAEASTSPGTSDVPNMERSPSERARSSRRRAVRHLLGAPEGGHLKVDELLSGVVLQVRERFRRTAARASVPALPLGQHQHSGSASSSARRSAERRAHKDAWERVQQRPAYEKGSHDQGSARRSDSKAARWDKERVGEISGSAPGAGTNYSNLTNSSPSSCRSSIVSVAAVPTLSVQQHV